MLAFLERVKGAALWATSGSDKRHIPHQALRDYDVTDAGCEEMRRRFADSFAGEDWDDIEPNTTIAAPR